MLPKFERKAFSFLLVVINTILLLTGCSNSPQLNKDPGHSQPAQNNTDTVPVKTDSATRFAWKPVHYDTSKNYIYLTFDDGPQNGTMNCYHIVKALGVKATFFMVGMHAADKPLRAIVDTIRDGYPDILLANHSYTHANNRYHYFYDHPYMAEADFTKAQESLDVPYKIIRLPGNSAWVRQG